MIVGRMNRRREQFTRDKLTTMGKPVFNMKTGKFEVIDEHSDNSKGVEDIVKRIWKNDPTLKEV